jgi:hypothetical protein
MGAAVSALFGVPLLLSGLARATAWSLGVPLDAGLPLVALHALLGVVGALIAYGAAWDAQKPRGT